MENVSCITKISYAHGLGGLSSSIRYATKGKPHNTANGTIHNRAFVVNGFNCSDSPKIAYREMKATLNKSYINHTNISLIRDIQSFKGLNFRSKNDRKMALKLDKQFIHNNFPDNQVLIVGHIDGKGSKFSKGHYIHFHNLICDRKLDTGKSIAKDCSFYKLAPRMDKVLKDNGYTPLAKPHKSKIDRSRGVYYHLFHGDSFIIYLQKQIENASKNALTSNEFVHNLKKRNINVERFKMTAKNWHRKVKLYQRPTKDGSYIKLSNGKFARYRKHWSYSFKYHNIPIKVRDKKLGTNYSNTHLLKQFNINYQRALMPKKSILHSLKSKRSLVSHKLSKNSSGVNFHHIPIYHSGSLRKYISREKADVDNEQRLLQNQDYLDNIKKQKKLYQLKRISKIDLKIAYIKSEIDLAKLINIKNNRGNLTMN